MVKSVLNQQQPQIEYTNPYLSEALDEHKRIGSILSDPALDNSEKQIKYQEAMKNYMTYMKKTVKHPAATGSPFQFNLQQQQQQQPVLFPQNPQQAMPLSQLDQPFSTKIEKPHYQAWPSSSTTQKKKDTHASMSDLSNDAYFGTMEDIINLPVTTNDEQSIVTGDADHMDHFVSLSDNEEKTPVNTKPYMLRDRAGKRRKVKYRKKPYETDPDTD